MDEKKLQRSNRCFHEDDPDHYRKLEDFHVQHAVHSLAIDPATHRVSQIDSQSILFTNGEPAATRQNTFDGLNSIWHTSRFPGNKNLLLGAWNATTQGEVGPRSKIGRGFKIDHPTTCWIATQGQ